MFDDVFGEVSFRAGWYTEDYIKFCDNQYKIYVRAKSYRKTDLITDDQRTSYASYKENRLAISNEIENMLASYKNKDFLNSLKPTGLTFERNGGYALLFDDDNDLDNGIAVVLSPNREVMTQDDYL